VDHDQDARAGFFLGINHPGQAGFYASVDGKWLGCDSKEPLKLLKWAHVAGTFDPAAGFMLYVNGERVGFNDANVTLTLDGKPIARGKDFRCGHRPTLEGTDLIVCIETESQASLTFHLEP
jgi:hypothetical protein